MTAPRYSASASSATRSAEVEPRFWRFEGLEGTREIFRCELCFHRCRIPAGTRGYCGVRGADASGFISPFLGRFISGAVDPVEKKPLYHWRPGSLIFSLGGLGCTMRCPFCQNHSIAQPRSLAAPPAELPVEALLDEVRSLKLSAVAYTYNEPTLQAEYILAAAPVLRGAGVATVMVTNGLFSDSPAEELTPWLEAANIDVKTFNSEAYAAMGGSLEAVKNNVARLVRAGVHVELTTLVVPGLSDDQDEFVTLTDWIAGLSPQIPFHISRYFPAHKYAAPPTDPDLLRRLRGIAEARLDHVHLGNMP